MNFSENIRGKMVLFFISVKLQEINAKFMQINRIINAFSKSMWLIEQLHMIIIDFFIWIRKRFFFITLKIDFLFAEIS